MGPDFIGIGAQRSGSSWLERNLRTHPDIWTTPLKEIHYFDTLDWGYKSDGYRALYKRHLRNRIRQTAADLIKLRYSFDRIPWDIRYFTQPRSDDWYASLFPEGRGKVKGEVTPAYAVLDEDKVALIARLFPDLKIVYMMRHPLDRLLSALKLNCKLSGRQVSSFGYDEIMMDAARHSDYKDILEKWERHFPKEQMFYAFFEEISDNPEALLARAYAFLEVGNAPDVMNEQAHKPRGQSLNDDDMDPALKTRMMEYYRPTLEWMAERFGGYPKSWLEQAKLIC